MDFTPEQSNAIHTHDKNLIVIAGAGSGKTRVLVERYLALLDANPTWPLNALVAITFTKKAAEEMRDRVRLALEVRAINDDRWNNLLVQIDGARIDTIHGLCANLLRANAAEANIDPEFTVLDELDAMILREDVVQSILSELVSSGSDELKLFNEYRDYEIVAILSNPDLLTADLPDLPDNLFEQWQNTWEENILAHTRNFLMSVHSIDMFEPIPNDNIGENWQVCHDALDFLENSDDPIECFHALQAISGIKMSGGAVKKWGDKETLNEAKASLTEIRDYVRETIKNIGNPPGELDRRAAELLPLWTLLLNKVAIAYSETKRKNAEVDFNDLEVLTHKLLEQYLHVAERYRGTEFKHLLVDEFQDTNAIQWQIVQALAGLDRAGSLFVVGDPKQSIYAFRGADVSVFGAVRKQIQDRDGLSLPLSTSFRTHAPLVSAFNAIFENILVRDDASVVADYQVEMDRMSASRQNPPDDYPALQLLCIDKNEYDETGQILTEGLNAAERRRWEAYEITLRIQHMVESKIKVFDKTQQMIRPAEFGDFAILFQSLSHVNEYEDVFKSVGLPFVTLSGRGYYGKQEVWDLLNLLQAVYNPADNLALASVLRSPLFGLSDDALLTLRLQKIEGGKKIEPLWQAISYPEDQLLSNEYGKIQFARECLYDLHSLAGRVTIFELLSYALERTGYLAVLTGLPDGARRRGNVEKLLGKSQTWGKPTLGEFSRYLRELSIREAREGEVSVVDAGGMVNIMTVHASKGLEYPVILLADASWIRRGGNTGIVSFDGYGEIACKVYDAEEGKSVDTYRSRHITNLRQLRENAERLRLLYVAATRAQDYLIVSGQVSCNKDGKWGSGGWLDLLLDVFDLKHEFFSGMDNVYPFDVIDIHVHTPRIRPDGSSQSVNKFLDWDIDLSSIEPVMPALLQAVPINPELKAHHLAATHIADLGCVDQSDTDEEKKFYRERFLRQVFHDAPSHIESISHHGDNVTARQIGDIVHEALRYGHHLDKSDDDLRKVLSSYAWRFGITNNQLRIQAVDRSMRLLVEYKDSVLHQWVSSAVEVYRELPFIYVLQEHVVHGIIDLLFKTADGQWILADYKTSKANPKELEYHARRYHLQLGIYAAAATEQLGGIVPATYVHYLRYNQVVKIYQDQWERALSQSLDVRIKNMLQENNSL